MAIHPAQVATINDVFTPSADEVDRARRLVQAFDDAVKRCDAVVRVDDKMVDAPVVARARKVLAAASFPRRTA
jgi:citrate lyase subunit beta/citryl-CoA lyase